MKESKMFNLQRRVAAWVHACFGIGILMDREERGLRVLEEAAELAQALGCTRSRCALIVDHVFSRPPGDPAQEVGGVATTLLAACRSIDEDFESLAEREVLRIESKDPEYFRHRNAEKAAAGIGSYRRDGELDEHATLIGKEP